MEFPPEDWDVFQATEFETAAARAVSELRVEIMAQIWLTGG